MGTKMGQKPLKIKAKNSINIVMDGWTPPPRPDDKSAIRKKPHRICVYR